MYNVVRRVLFALSRSERMQRLIIQFPPSRRVARRFVAGEELADAVEVIRQLNARGMEATLDHLGENVTTPEEAQEAAHAYEVALDAIDQHGLRSGVSVKLTHLGLDLDDTLAYENVRRIAAKAAEVGRFVRIDMESSAYTDITLEIYRRVRREFDNVGTVVQAYLYRTPQDVAQLIEEGIANLRLVKGAYDEPPSIALRDRERIREAFFALIRQMWAPEARAKGSFAAIGSHDEAVIQYANALARRLDLSPDDYEFQFLYGIRRERAQQLVDEGYRMRIYVPYGSQWYPYFMRRLAERPANLLFFLRALVGG
ncbi:MAG: proline dehydrogenase [Chloroflexi bacterium]|nr:proline dehydrogenase [Chloroflexota bacterium]